MKFNFNNCVLFFLFFIPSYSAAESLLEKHPPYTIEINCPENKGTCTLTLSDTLANRKFNTRIVLDLNVVGFIWYPDHLVEIIQRFGTNDSYSKFLDYKNFTLSLNSYSDVVAVDENKNLLAYSGIDEKSHADAVLVQPIFKNTKKIFAITRKFEVTPSISVRREYSKFTKNNTLILDYDADENGKLKPMTEEIKIPPTLATDPNFDYLN